MKSGNIGNTLATEFACEYARVASVAGVAKEKIGPCRKRCFGIKSRGLRTRERCSLRYLRKSGNSGNTGNTYVIAAQSAKAVWQQTGNTGNISTEVSS